MRTAADLDESIRELVVAGRAAWEQREYARARQIFEQVLEIATQSGDTFGQSAAHHFLGNIAFNERKDEISREHHTKTLELARREDDFQGIATSLGSLALIAVAEERMDEAATLYDQAVGAYQRADMHDRAESLRSGAADLLSGRVALEDVVHRQARA